MPPPKRVVLLVIDTLRRDHVGAYGYEKNTTPHLDSLAKEGVLFKDAYSNCSWTQPSMASLFTGAYPLVHKVTEPPDSEFVAAAVLPPGVTTMAEFLKAEGMTTHAVSSQPWCNDLSGFDQGFDGFEKVSTILDTREAEKVMDQSLEWLEKQGPDEDFFLYIHIMGPHFPYIPPPEWQGKFTGPRLPEIRSMLEDKNYVDQSRVLHKKRHRFASDDGLLAELEGLYDEEVAFSDHQLARLMARLDKQGMSEGTMVIVLSDHGEEFVEHGRFFHGHSLYRELLEVPLVIWYPPLGKGVEVDDMVSLVDVFPTLIELFDGKKPDHCQGKSLAPLLWKDGGHGPILAELVGHGLGKLTTPDYSFIYQGEIRDKSEQTMLFDRKADPHEEKDISDKKPELNNEMLSRFLEMESINMDKAVKPVKSRKLDDEQQKRLRALGYLH